MKLKDYIPLFEDLVYHSNSVVINSIYGRPMYIEGGIIDELIISMLIESEYRKTDRDTAEIVCNKKEVEMLIEYINDYLNGDLGPVDHIIKEDDLGESYIKVRDYGGEFYIKFKKDDVMTSSYGYLFEKETIEQLLPILIEWTKSGEIKNIIL